MKKGKAPDGPQGHDTASETCLNLSLTHSQVLRRRGSKWRQRLCHWQLWPPMSLIWMLSDTRQGQEEDNLMWAHGAAPEKVGVPGRQQMLASSLQLHHPHLAALPEFCPFHANLLLHIPGPLHLGFLSPPCALPLLLPEYPRPSGLTWVSSPQGSETWLAPCILSVWSWCLPSTLQALSGQDSCLHSLLICAGHRHWTRMHSCQCSHGLGLNPGACL